ncbi:hypothetical protein ESCOMM280M2_21780 [Escherichia coli]
MQSAPLLGALFLCHVHLYMLVNNQRITLVHIGAKVVIYLKIS